MEHVNDWAGMSVANVHDVDEVIPDSFGSACIMIGRLPSRMSNPGLQVSAPVSYRATAAEYIVNHISDLNRSAENVIRISRFRTAQRC